MPKVYVLGAGLTGLTIASELKEGFDESIVIDGDSRAGGLCRTDNFHGFNHEFGVHVLYAKNEDQKRFWDGLIGNVVRDYRVRCAVDGKLDSFEALWDFPISRHSLSRLNVDPEKVVTEPDYTNFETYMVSQIGRVAYELFVKHYNIKQWGIHPRDMSAEWAASRPLTLKEKHPKMFGEMWAGHPGSFNPAFEKLTEELTLRLNETVNGFIIGSGRVVGVTTTKETIYFELDDVIINTLPLDEVFWYEKALPWRGVYTLFAIVGTHNALPAYSVTFPNHHPWTRCVEYKKITGQELTGSSLISFDIPYDPAKGKPDEDEMLDKARGFVAKEMNTSILQYYTRAVDKVYPVSTKNSIERCGFLLKKAADMKNFYTCGRLGLYAYTSMSRAVEMAHETAELIRRPNTAEERLAHYLKLRSNLW